MGDSAPGHRRPWETSLRWARAAAARPAVSLAAGVAFSLAFVLPALWPLALAAPAALFHVARKEPCRRAAIAGALFGAGVGAFGLFWVTAVTSLGWAGLVAFVSLHFAAAAALVSLCCGTGFQPVTVHPPARRRAGCCMPGRSGAARAGRQDARAKDRLRLPVAAVGPAVWAACELSRANLLTGFPWLFLGHALADAPLAIQVADLGGAYAASFVWALPAAALADILAARADRRRNAEVGRRSCSAFWRPVLAASLVVAAALAYGAYRLAATTTREGPRLVLVQGNIHTPRASESGEAAAEVDEEIWRAHEELTRRHAAEGDLVVWSESMLPSWFNDPGDPEAPKWAAKLAALLAECGRPLLTGANAVGLHPGAPVSAPPPKPPPTGRFEYNSAFLIGLRDGRCSIEGRYDKMHLVPFGEYVPLSRWPVFPGFTPYAADDPGYSHGDPGQPLIEFAGTKLGVLICYESAFAHLSRRAEALGADVLVNLSSEAWFAGTSEIPQLARIARFRAVETRLPVVRCCNVGVTAVVDPAGRVVATLEGSDRPAGARGVLVAEAPLRASPTRSVYACAGDVFAWLCAAWVSGLAALAVAGRILARRTAAEGTAR